MVYIYIYDRVRSSGYLRGPGGNVSCFSGEALGELRMPRRLIKEAPRSSRGDEEPQGIAMEPGKKEDK
jgi:hypothetical protein